MTGWVKRRSTRTTTVLSGLSLTTTPCSMRFGIFRLLRLGFRARGALLRPRRLLAHGRRLAGALLRRDGLDPRDVASNLPHPCGVLELARRPLEAQVEPLLLQLESLVVELIEGHVPEIIGLHVTPLPAYSAMRSMKRVLIGSLAAASPSASRATATDTPSTSNNTRPGLTRATQYSGAPLPEPMRTSSGFFDTGTSG